MAGIHFITPNILSYNPPAAGPAGFDPTLGGTLTQLDHWYDFTDSATMTLTGTQVDAISSKGNAASFDITSRTGTVTYNTTYTSFATLSYLQRQTTLPATIQNTTGDQTVVTIASYADTGVSGDIRTTWGLNGYFDDRNYGWMTNSDLSGVRSQVTAAGTGVPTLGFYDWNGGNYGTVWKGVSHSTTYMFALKSTWPTSTSNTVISSLDGAAFAGSNTKTGMANRGKTPRATIGTRPNLAGNYGDLPMELYHILIYNEALSDANIADLYTNWSSS